MGIRRIAVLALALAACAAWAGGRAQEPQLDPSDYLKYVKYLASGRLKGRGTGTPGLEKAAGYIARQFRLAGLKPVGGGYFQEFPVTIQARMGPGNHLVIEESGTRKRLKAPQDFVPLNFSSSGRISCEVVFAGYGISAGEYHYDDYAQLDVKNKCVLLLRYEPREFDENSVFAGKAYTMHAQLPNKAFNARLHGARAVILVNNMANRSGETDTLETFGRTNGPADAGIGFIQIRWETAEQWMRSAGKDLRGIVERIDKDMKPESFPFPGTLKLDLETDVRHVQKQVRNVVGYLPGETDEYVAIGAHYDHLGLGDQHSLAPSMIGTVHYGADDNASGSAGLIELARYFGARPRMKRGVLFMAFAGEELGLLGSSHYVDQPQLPLDKAVAMINMDMIGRVRDGKLYVGGSGTGTNLKALVAKAARGVDLNVDLTDKSGDGSSDHTSFTTKQVPVLFFFSGLHADYHKPGDTWDKIDAPQAIKVLRIVAAVTGELARAERPRFVTVEPPRMPVSGSTGGSGYGPYFGSIPDFTELPNGVRFADIRTGSPAEKAGLRPGDILIGFDGKEIRNLYDYTYALRARKPGDVVNVKVLRSGAPIEAKVTLEQRK